MDLEMLTLRVLRELDALGVNYFVIGGTLLGLHNENRVMLYDYDADIHVHCESTDLIRRHNWKSVYIHVYEGFGGFRFKSSMFSHLRLAAFVQCPCGDKHMHFTWKHLEKLYHKAILPVDWIYPLQRKRLHYSDVNVPREPLRILHKMYGNFTKEPLNGPKEKFRAFWERQLWARVIPLANGLSPWGTLDNRSTCQSLPP